MKRRLGFLVVAVAATALGGSSTGGGQIGDTGSAILGGAQLGGSIATAGNGAVVDASLLFDLNPDGAGSGPGDTILDLFSSLSIIVDCSGEDVSGGTLTCDTAGAMPAAGGGTDPTSGVAVPFTSSTARGFTVVSGGDYYEASSTSVGDVTTPDLAVEAVFFASYDAAGSDSVISKRDDGGTGNGWELAQTASTTATFTIDAGASAQTATCTLVASAWNHVLCFADRDSASGMRCACNSTLGTATNPTAAAGTLTTTDPLRIGGAVTAGTQFQGTIAYAKAWAGTGLDTTSYQAEASARFTQVIGVYPSTAGGQDYPSTLTRATVKHVDIDRDGDGVRKLHRVANAWIGVARRKELTGGEYMEGVLIEPQATNLALQSATFDNASWTEANVDAIAAGTTEAPDGNLAGDTMHAVDAAGDVEHYVRQAVTLTATTYTASAWVKAGADADVTHAWIRDNTVANAIGHIVLSTCAAGTKGAGASQLHAEAWGNGWCRVGITFTGTVAAHDIDIGYGNADNDTTFDDGTDADSDLIVWGAQVEAHPLPTSYIATTTASATRNADDLRYAAASNADRTIGTIVTTSMFPNVNWTGGNGATVYVAETGTVNNAVGQFCDPSSDFFMVNLLSGGAHQYGAAGTSVSGIDCADGESHQTQIYWTTNRARLYADGSAAGAEDTSITVPATFGTIYIGKNSQTAAYANGIIGRVRIYNEVRTP